jgi:ComF family protein
MQRPSLRLLSNDFLSLFYPHLCVACGDRVPPRQEIICVHCLASLPKTSHHHDKENDFTDKFIGRVPLQAAAAYLYFNKGTRTQRLVHQLKYEGRRDIGLRLGRSFGNLLAASPHFGGVDLVLPVPLHPLRLRARGYNQSEMIALGIAEALGKTCPSKLLVRSRYTETQTKKSRAERFGNVENAFALPLPGQLQGRHVLLVDDVLTTGATLEACALQLATVAGLKISMATLAFATS